MVNIHGAEVVSDLGEICSLIEAMSIAGIIASFIGVIAYIATFVTFNKKIYHYLIPTIVFVLTFVAVTLANVDERKEYKVILTKRISVQQILTNYDIVDVDEETYILNNKEYKRPLLKIREKEEKE